MHFQCQKSIIFISMKVQWKSALFIFTIVLCGLTFESCKPKEPKDPSTSMSSQSDSISSQPEEETQPLKANNIIAYGGASNPEVSVALETFSPFTLIQTLASRSIEIKDSLEMVRETQSLTDPKDSLIFMPYETEAHLAILEYRRLMASGPVLKDLCPSLIEINRITEANDSSFNILPPAEKSKFLSHGSFFFLGGAPFIDKIRTDDNTVYTDPQGKPETRFVSSVPENASYLLNSIYHFKNGPINITFGPPLNSYDNGPKEVNGIGSLCHNFINRMPVFFLTENGVVPAHLIAVTIKLVPENMGCVSDQPQIEFACSQNIEEDEILGVYIPYHSAPISSSTISRPNNLLWTADINSDGIPDIACVSGTFEGISSDTMMESLWYVNIDGVWKIIDWAQDLDCT